MIKWLFAEPPTVGSIWSARGANPFDLRLSRVVAVEKGWVQAQGIDNLFVFVQSVRTFRSNHKEVPEFQ